MKNRLLSCALSLFLTTSGVSVALAAEHQVLMLDANETGEMVFEPNLIRVAVGDTVKFIPTDWGHNAESVKGLSPAGSKPFYGKLNEEVTVTLLKEGVHVIQCNPHSLMGMVAVIVAGSATNLVEIKAQSAIINAKYRMKRERLDDIFARISSE